MRRPSPGVRGLPSLTMRRVMGPPPGSRRLAYHSGAPIVRRSRKGNPMDIVDVIRRFNADRDPERLALKYARMRTDRPLWCGLVLSYSTRATATRSAAA